MSAKKIRKSRKIKKSYGLSKNEKREILDALATLARADIKLVITIEAKPKHPDPGYYL